MKSSLNVKYNYEENRIVIYRIDNDDFLPKNHVKMPIKERAKFWIEHVKIYASLGLVEHFSHNGFIRGKEQKELESALANMVEIKVVRVKVSDGDDYLETVCKTAADSEEIFCNDLSQKENDKKPPKFNFEPSEKKE